MMFSLKTLFPLTLLAATAAASYSGDMTYYSTEGAAGKCGWTNHNSDHIVALSAAQLGGTSACGKHIRIHYKDKSVTAKVVDLCPGCGSGSIDVTESTFSVIADPNQGRVHVTWEFI
ncbi:RlpA-like double-psi beta-barrel-protein domain-containing protein-containing protein [Poronia punctata]|nr:RlpA-like double-psi beta-barrel-protein domain-containing protein-containing protein [Poronia punctata]